jgi:hypothetical protein
MPKITKTQKIGVFSEKLTVEVDDDRQLMIKCHPDFKRELGKLLKEIKEDARQHVHRHHHITGALERSIQVGPIKTTAGGQRLVGTVKAGSRLAPYAWYVHEGAKPHRMPKEGDSMGKGSMRFWMPEKPSRTYTVKARQAYYAAGPRGGKIKLFRDVTKTVTVGGGPGVGDTKRVNHPGYKGDPFLNRAAIRAVRKYGGARKQSDGTWIR